MGEKRIFDRLTAAGMSKEGAAAMLGNIWAESSCEALRVQYDYETDRGRSRQYAANVDSGRISRYGFAHDELGWGLIQWTFWSRKFGLYDFAKDRGVSIGDEDMQTDYIIAELKRDAASLWAFLRETEDINTASDRICKEFERPQVNNFDDRREFAKNVYRRCAFAEPEPEPEPEYKSEYWPPRMIDKTMEGHDAAVLQTLLIAHNEIRYAVSVTGYFDEDTEKAVKLFQADHGLTADGVVGPATWNELLKH